MAVISDAELCDIAVKIAYESGAVAREIGVRVDIIEPGVVRLVSLTRGGPRLLLGSNGRALQYTIPSLAIPDDETVRSRQANVHKSPTFFSPGQVILGRRLSS